MSLKKYFQMSKNNEIDSEIAFFMKDFCDLHFVQCSNYISFYACDDEQIINFVTKRLIIRDIIRHFITFKCGRIVCA